MTRNRTRPSDDEVEESFRNRYAILLPHLSENQIRLVLGADADSMTEQGRDGVGIVARAAGLAPGIVTAGSAELRTLNTPTK